MKPTFWAYYFKKLTRDDIKRKFRQIREEINNPKKKKNIMQKLSGFFRQLSMKQDNNKI